MQAAPRVAAVGNVAEMRARTAMIGGLVVSVAALGAASALAVGPSIVPPQPPAPAAATTPTPAAATPAATALTLLPHPRVSDGTAPLVVRLSGPVAHGSPMPQLSPAVAGKWTAAGDLETFTPTSTLAPCASYSLTIWAQTTATGRPPLGARRVVPFAVACPSTRAAQQALARLDYLPYAFHTTAGAQRGGETRQRAAEHAFAPQAGRFVRDVKGAPGLAAGQLDVTTRGALMLFQSRHAITPSGVADAATWAALLGAEAAAASDRTPYTFVTVSQRLPQTLEVHRGNRVALRTAVNTGVSGAPTANGTFPIFQRLTSTTMTGTNPDGSHYSDPGVPWVNYFNGGDAVHGFNRASYGSPQSDGCVELPPRTAAAVYRMLAIGDLVVVSG
jgi:peptidoglycan hydrolase-like protein with peptidoglycan-binding domain